MRPPFAQQPLEAYMSRNQDTRRPTEEKAGPRRSRMPKVVYDTADLARYCLTDHSDSPVFPAPIDETLCQEIAPALRELSSMAFHEELSPEINEHPCADCWEVAHIIKEAMRLAYGLQDLIDAGKRTNEVERQQCAELFAAFEKIHAASRASENRRHGKSTNEQPKPEAGKKGKRTSYTAGFDWPYFGVHHNDDVIVEATGLAPIGKLVLTVRKDDPEALCFARVCAIKGNIVRLANKDGETDDQPLSSIIGPAVEIRHDDCVQAKVKPLRGRLNKLLSDDDHTLNLTKAYEIEKEIFDLEYPLEVEEGGDEWPEEIGGEVDDET
jgi:hypothetical protein